MAGGKGTRISSVTNQIPKSLIPINGQPVLEYQILKLKEYGIRDIILAIGHLGQKIINYFGDGCSLGVNIEYYFEDHPLGNAGALFKIQDKLSDDFILINGDLIFDIDFDRLLKFHREKKSLATLVTHPNSHPFDSDVVLTNDNSCVTGWILKNGQRPTYYKNEVNSGIHILSKTLFEHELHQEFVDLNKDILRPIVSGGRIFAYETSEYIKDMGTPERLKQVSDDLKFGIVQAKCLKNRQKAIFLDRDGTINKYVGFLTKPEEFVINDGVIDAIKRINQSSYLCIVVTNQPVIARGDVTFDGLSEIHNKMETILGDGNCYLDAIYYCPHHPDKGFVGEVPELKIDCNCRKPKPGLLLKASERYNIDLLKSWVIGDGDSDILVGKNCGCKTIYIGTKKIQTEPDYIANNLLDAVSIIMESKND